MANLFIAYDLDKPGQDYSAVEQAIKALGVAVKVQMSLYYVKSSLSHEQAAKRVREAMDTNDRLIVIDAKDAYFFNAMPPSADVMQKHWLL